MTARLVALTLFALFSALMLGLAAGAVWMVASLYLRHPLPWLALPMGAVLALTIRGCIQRAGPGSALLAAVATALAGLYVKLLIAGVLIAGTLGLGLLDALRTAGLAMLWQMDRLAWSPADIAWLVAGMLLAAWLAWRQRRRH